MVQPDLFIVPAAQASNDWSTYRDLVLAIEVISPGSRRTDRVEKRRLYQEHRVGTYWIVDEEARLIEVWRPDDLRPEFVTEELRWRPATADPEFRLSLDSLFANLPE